MRALKSQVLAKRGTLPLVAAFIAVLLGLGGCYMTNLHLGSAADSKVDRALVGDWKLVDPNDATNTATMLVRNFDDKQYYVEWSEKSGEGDALKTTRMRAHGVKVKSATFIEVAELTDDGSLPEKHVLLRVELKDDKLTLRQLNEKFFEGVTTEPALRAKVEANLDNAEMYAATISGTKSAQ